MTTREIQGHLCELYGVEVSPALISNVTDAVLEEVKLWQNRPLEAVYPIVYLDAIHLKLRTSGQVQSQAVYLALGINLEGHKELLGLWGRGVRGLEVLLNVLTELQNRGVQDILIACVDGLKGFPEDSGPALPRAPDPPFSEVRELEGTQGRRSRFARHLHRAERGGGGAGARGLRFDLGFALPQHLEIVAEPVGERYSLLQLSGSDSEGHLHHERDRIGARLHQKSHCQARRVPDRGLGAESPVPRDPESVRTLEAPNQRLDRGAQSSNHRVRETRPELIRWSFTKDLTHPERRITLEDSLRPGPQQREQSGRYSCRSTSAGFSVVQRKVLRPNDFLALKHISPASR